MKSLVFLALALLATPAHAWEARRGGDWCLVETDAPDGTFLIVRAERSGEVTLHLHNLNWWAVGEGKPKPLGIRFDAARPMPINAVGTDGNADIGGGVWFVTDARFRRELARANRMRVTLNGWKLSDLPLRGSGKAMAALAACAENLRE